MRTIKVNQIESVLDEYGSRLSKDKVYSILFVSELDDYVKHIIKEWLEKQRERGVTYSSRQPAYFYNKDSQGFLKKTNYYAYFDQVNIVFDNIETGHGGDADFKSDYVNAVSNLKNKEGKYHNENIQLVIIRTLTPAWVSNKPLFSVNDTSLFDEIINIEMDKEVFKEMYLGEMEDWIHECEEKIKNSDASADIAKFEIRLNKEKNRYALAKFVLEHASFEFVPLKRLEGEYDSVTGTATEGFSPVKFCNIFNYISSVEDVQKRCDSYRVSEKYKKILLEIINEYKQTLI